VRWFLASRNDYVSTLQRLLANLDRRAPSETSAAMECGNARLDESRFPIFWDRFGECTLKAHQFGPINLQLIGPDSVPLHSPGPINCFRSTHKHLFGIASAQCTRTAERS